MDEQIKCAQRYLGHLQRFYKRKVQPKGVGGVEEFDYSFGPPFDRFNCMYLDADGPGNGVATAKMTIKRKYGYISNHCRVGLLHWRQNVDFQPALDCDPAVRYTVT